MIFVSPDLLLAMVDKPAMVEWMLGSNVSLREARYGSGYGSYFGWYGTGIR